ncbi:MAG: DHA2 family efflux MFS transporter permease subunit [Rhodospirillales bacterium]|nr:DHA2 family efflux MFS transporter permease subunit [Rhodospirillales bacterium]
MSAAEETADAAWRPRANPWLIATVVTMAAFMEILDTTIVNVSLPHIAGSLSSSYDQATWTLTSYLVANGIVLPISGWIGRVIGRKRYFLISIIMFSAFSFLCGSAVSLGELVFFRLMQGFFGGGLQPNQQAIVLDVMPPEQRGRAFGVVAVAVVFAPIIGPTLGGWITDSYSWRWVFFINVPIGIIAFFLVNRLVDDPPWVLRSRAQGRHFDLPGLLLIALAIGCTQIMLDRGQDADWFSSPMIRTLAFAAALGWIGAIFWLTEARRPIVNLAVFTDRNFALGCLMVLALFSVLYSSGVLIPQLAQVYLGYTALLAGLVLSPGGLVVLFFIPIVTRVLMPRVQTRLIIAFGFFVLGLAMLYTSHLAPDLNFRTLMLMRMAQSAGLAFLFVPISTSAYLTLPRSLNTDASALYVLIRNIAGSAAISISTAMVTAGTQANMAALATNLSPGNEAYRSTLATVSAALAGLGRAPAQIPSDALGWLYQTLNSQAAFVAYRNVFIDYAVVAFAIIPLAFLFSPVRAGRMRGGE